MPVARIVAALEIEDTDQALLEVARTYAGAFGAEVYVLHVVPEDPAFVGWPKAGEAAAGSGGDVEIGYAYDRRLRAEETRRKHAALQARADEIEATGVQATALLIEGLAAEKITGEAERLGAGLIVVGSHRRGPLGEWLLGSISRAVLRAAPCPVLVVPLTG